MRLFISLSVAVVLAVTLLTACNSLDKPHATEQGSAQTTAANTQPGQTTTVNPPVNDGVRRVTTAELQEAMDKGNVVVIDVRNDASFKAGHIKGARLIPAAEIADHIKELPSDKMIVTYCS